MLKKVAASFVLAFVGSCSSTTPDGPASGCDNNDGCAGGEVCIAGVCEVLCTSDANCPNGEICEADRCVLGMRTDGPLILSVNGDGTLDGDPGHAPNHIASGLLIMGDRLTGASAELTGPASVVLTVDPSSTDTLMVAQLPPTLVSDTYTLRVFNTAGEDQMTITVLQGEDGPTGPTGAMGPSGPPGPDPNVALGGGLVGDGTLGSPLAIDPTLLAKLNGLTVVSAQGAGVSAGGMVARSVSVDGNDLAVADTADGIFTVVVDRATGAVNMATTQNWPLGSLVQAANLASMLNARGGDEIVALASKGDASAFLEAAVGNDILYEALLRCGASESILTLGPQSSMALIGICGDGPGSGFQNVKSDYDMGMNPDGGAARVSSFSFGGGLMGGSGRSDDEFLSWRGTYPAILNRQTSCGGVVTGSYPTHLDHKTIVGEVIFTRAGRTSFAHAGWTNNCNAQPQVWVNYYIWSPVNQNIDISWAGLDTMEIFHGSGEDPSYSSLDSNASEINTTTSVPFVAGSNNLIVSSFWNNQAAAAEVRTEFFRQAGLRVDWRRLMAELRK